MRAAKKPGRLAAIDKLPDWAFEDKRWALDELAKRQRDQLDILAEFNERLAAAAAEHGVSPAPVISKSAFNRRALRIAINEEWRALAREVAPKLDGASSDDLTVMASETLKTLVFEATSNLGHVAADGDTAEMLLALSRALKTAVESRKISDDVRRRLEAEFKQKADAALDHVAKAKGLSAETVEQIKASILGVAA